MRDYLDFVRQQPCVVCGSSPCEAHHVKGVGHFSGVGLKASDYLAMPMCSRHHRALHDSGKGRDRQLQWIVRTLRRASASGFFGARSDDLHRTLAALPGDPDPHVLREICASLEGRA